MPTPRTRHLKTAPYLKIKQKGRPGIKYTYLHLTVFCAILAVLCTGLLLFRWTAGRHALRQLENLGGSAMSEVSEKSDPALPPLPDIFLTGGPRIAGSYTPPTHTRADDILPQYQALYQENNDLIGWLEIPDTMLNLPVMYTPENSEYYLRRLFDGTESLYGVPFLDGDCSVSPRSDNLILHGHHMRDGTMFSTLADYQDEQFFREHPTIRFDTIYEEGQYEIISAFLSVYDENDGSDDLYYNFIDARDPADFDRFVAQIKERSLYDTGKTAVYGDELITLITCMYHVENGRMNVVAKKVG